ncbi:unnamed protein product [Calypogeia fissa]
MSATMNSTGPAVSGSNVTITKLEEEVWEGCNLQHGEMSADGVKIHFVEAGDPAGKLVVLLHGFPNIWFVWRNQFKPLVEAGYHVIAPDLRGYNRSSRFEITKDYGRSAVLPDIEKLIDNFGAGKPAILAGHDWGAIIAWAFAEDYPSKVEKLVPTNTGRLSDFQKTLRSNFRQLLKTWYIGFFQISIIPEAYFTKLIVKGIKSFKSICPGATDEDIKRLLEAFTLPGGAMGGIRYYRAASQGLWNRPDGSVPVVSCPVTTLWGDQDAYNLPIIAETDKEKAPNFKLVHLPKSGHWPMWDEPDLYNKFFLEAISGD